MTGPLPDPQRRRRNAPTIATRKLPAAGFDGPIPECPYDLGEPGLRWWAWVWRTPQAARFDVGALYALARRAQLEDQMAAIAHAQAPDYSELEGVSDEEERRSYLDWLLGALQSRATKTVALMREMRELDDRFGLSPKGLAALRWEIEAADAPAEVVAPPARSLRAVS